MQLWLLCADDTTGYSISAPPLGLRAGGFAVVRGDGRLSGNSAFAFVARGAFEMVGQQLAAGDSIRADEPVTVRGAGELLVVEF